MLAFKYIFPHLLFLQILVPGKFLNLSSVEHVPVNWTLPFTQPYPVAWPIPVSEPISVPARYSMAKPVPAPKSITVLVHSLLPPLMPLGHGGLSVAACSGLREAALCGADLGGIGGTGVVMQSFINSVYHILLSRTRRDQKACFCYSA